MISGTCPASEWHPERPAPRDDEPAKPKGPQRSAPPPLPLSHRRGPFFDTLSLPSLQPLSQHPRSSTDDWASDMRSDNTGIVGTGGMPGGSVGCLPTRTHPFLTLVDVRAGAPARVSEPQLPTAKSVIAQQFSIWTAVWRVRGHSGPRTGDNPRIWHARRSAEEVPAICVSQARHFVLVQQQLGILVAAECT